ncbi:glycosyltransferase family 4 protein [Acinetobacter pecorum]|uniref:glycosyltransferase family 4 protein n=1 Tax=Acinetobacter pecorum TaxID=2762215 RepID=UPI003EE8020E
MKFKIVHLTSVHQRYDARICYKESLSLSHKYIVSLVVADGKGDEKIDNLSIIDIGKFSGRKNRVLKGSHLLFLKALELDAHIYHIHDPELIFMGLNLKKEGKKVIFDAHEDFPKQILTKPYLPFSLRKVISFFAAFGERILCRKFDGIVGATPFIANKFLKINHNVVNINNYPKIEELQSIERPQSQRVQGQVCYIGGISLERGIKEVVQALTKTKNNVNLKLAGKFHSEELEKDIKQEEGWGKTEFLGFVGRKEIRKLLSTTQIGLVTLHPTVSYLDSLPVKLFEYMCAGIPVIASDFPLWREIVLKHNCGLCVDPQDPTAIAEAIDYLIDHPKEAEQMGKNGFKAIQAEFNWLNEESKLLKFYEGIIG